jgi:hypothetical protein
MPGPTYPAAREAAPRIHALFEQHQARAAAGATNRMAALPAPEVIEALISAAFWASLRREEGYVPRISLAWLPPEQAVAPLVFAEALPLRSDRLAKVAPAVERAGIHLGVWHAGDGFAVWGTIRHVPSVCFVLEVAAPGLLVVKHHRADQAGKFFNVATLEGEQVKFIDERASSLRVAAPVLSSLLGGGGAGPAAPSGVDVLVELGVSMRAHGRGGALVLVPGDDGAWRESVVQPMTYAVTPPFPGLSTLAHERPDASRQSVWRADLRRAVEAMAGLTAVDGATIVTPAYDLLGFGAKLTRRLGRGPVGRVLATEPIEGHVPALVEPAHLGGTRHLSAAQFIHDQRDAVALVASQDGQFTIFGWAPEHELVQAHRVEALLF